MTTRITIEQGPLIHEVTVKVTDDTGRNESRTVPSYPRPGSESYIKFVDALDSFMWGGPR